MWNELITPQKPRSAQPETVELSRAQRNAIQDLVRDPHMHIRAMLDDIIKTKPLPDGASAEQIRQHGVTEALKAQLTDQYALALYDALGGDPKNDETLRTHRPINTMRELRSAMQDSMNTVDKKVTAASAASEGEGASHLYRIDLYRIIHRRLLDDIGNLGKTVGGHAL